jgi:putative flippase GtrA
MSLLGSLSRHPLSSIAATATDFTIMITLVSLLSLPPSAGTAMGAACGAGVNFMLGRWWVFRATEGHAGAQAGRYALVSLGSLMLNTAGVYLFSEIHNINYVAARAFVAVTVSFGWNFVLHRFFVFGGTDS